MFNLNKKNSNKEFIKYENGKLISIEVEEKQNPFIADEPVSSTESLLAKFRPTPESIKNGKMKIVTFFTSTPIKLIGVLLFLSFFGFNVYRYMTLPNKASDADNAILSQATSLTTNMPPKSKTSGTVSTSTSATNVKKTSNSSPTSSSKTTSNQDDNLSTESNPLKTTLETANSVNIQLVQITDEELSNIENYINNKTNLLTLESDMETSYESKQSLYTNLAQNESIFTQAQAQDFYQTTEARLMNSIKESKTINTLLQGNFDRTTLNNEVTNWINKEKTLRDAQDTSLISLLKAHQIQYSIDSTNQQIKYTLN